MMLWLLGANAWILHYLWVHFHYRWPCSHELLYCVNSYYLGKRLYIIEFHSMNRLFERFSSRLSVMSHEKPWFIQMKHFAQALGGSSVVSSLYIMKSVLCSSVVESMIAQTSQTLSNVKSTPNILSVVRLLSTVKKDKGNPRRSELMSTVCPSDKRALRIVRSVLSVSISTTQIETPL